MYCKLLWKNLGVPCRALKWSFNSIKLTGKGIEMDKFLSTLISSTDVSEAQRRNTQGLLRNILLTVIVVSSLIALVDGILLNRSTTLFALGPLAIASIISLVYLQRQVFWPARVIIPFGALISICFIIWVGNGLHDVGISSFGIVIILAGLTLGGNGLIAFGLLSALAVTFIGVAEINGYIPYGYGTSVSDIIIISVAILAGAFLLRLLLNRLQQSIFQLQESEQNQIQANTELIGLKESLENRVAERTQDLENRSTELEAANARIQRRAAQFEALAQVTQSITAIRDLKDLLPRITVMISEKFDFYHVGIFLLDEINEYAVLSAANSAGGQRMLERKHRLRVGAEGIVGFVAMNAKPRIAMDVGADASFFNNPDLPDTHSEMGLPLISKNIIVGVLDVQSTEVGAFSNEDVQMLSLLADQVSLAIENARLFDETRRALAESEMMTRRTMREAWSRLPEKIKLHGYRYNVTGAAPLTNPVALPESKSGGGKGEETEANQTVVPIAIRGEVLGKLVVQSPASKPWNQDQLDIIHAVAERVALSAENARLFDETTARAERERLVSEITGKIRSHNDPQAMIQTAMEELRAALGASRVEIIQQKPNNTVTENRQVKP
jgi:GAF domain-containing protein